MTSSLKSAPLVQIALPIGLVASTLKRVSMKAESRFHGAATLASVASAPGEGDVLGEDDPLGEGDAPLDCGEALVVATPSSREPCTDSNTMSPSEASCSPSTSDNISSISTRVSSESILDWTALSTH